MHVFSRGKRDKRHGVFLYNVVFLLKIKVAGFKVGAGATTTH